MGKQKGANTKKEAGNARKAEQAQKKASEAAAREEAAEAERWNQGSKNSSKKYMPFSYFSFLLFK